jgi:hypothetical protein
VLLVLCGYYMNTKWSYGGLTVFTTSSALLLTYCRYCVGCVVLLADQLGALHVHACRRSSWVLHHQQQQSGALP